jgi:hypothetical protein
MTDLTQAQRNLALYRRYFDMARRTSGGVSESYECMAREMLRRAARIDPAAVRMSAKATAIPGAGS